MVPHSQPAVSVPEEEVSAYHEDICRAPVTLTDVEYWLSHEDQYRIKNRASEVTMQSPKVPKTKL